MAMGRLGRRSLQRSCKNRVEPAGSTEKSDPWPVRHGQRIGPACKPVYTGLDRAVLVKTGNSTDFKKNRIGRRLSIAVLPSSCRRAAAFAWCVLCGASVLSCRRVRPAAVTSSFRALPATGSSVPVASGRLRRVLLAVVLSTAINFKD
ncbi:hypothetical protein PIB30_018508 [Stylosanthes scabra]|uniref:Uncharacterized protein n=1 Tax=Stylosanthes scabra TaxID=79078 RepID=A0ABU6X6A1_9FABA|nr:hypothetical protein [Stylosanthes scabra]